VRRRPTAGAVALAVAWAAGVTLGAIRTSDPAGLSARAPLRLAETGLYEADGFGVVGARNRPFRPQYPLWTDGAAKARWIYLPPGSAIDASNAAQWEFPVGTRFWKEFSFAGRKVETRMLWKVSESRWIGASYAWNAEGTDAVLAPAEGLTTSVEVAPGRRHRIPSALDCLTCHGSTPTKPLGFTALQLSTDRDPNAIHGEPLSPGVLTIKTLVDERLISPPQDDLVSNPPRIATGNPRTRSVLGYLSANCGGCHNGAGEIDASGFVLKNSDLLKDADTVARSLLGQPTKWQIPGAPDGTSTLVHAGAPDVSAIALRMRSRRPASQMPPLGTVVRDNAALEAITAWIANDLSASTFHR
jgi:hypothetical protein